MEEEWKTVIGHGLIGTALAKCFMPKLNWFAGRPTLNGLQPTLMGMGSVYLCAGVSGYEQCQGSPEAYRINVDGTIAFAKRAMQQGAFFVFISTRAVEWGDQSDYTRHKQLVETALHSLGPHAVIRPTCKITQDNVADFAALLADIGSRKIGGIHRIP